MIKKNNSVLPATFLFDLPLPPPHLHSKLDVDTLVNPPHPVSIPQSTVVSSSLMILLFFLLSGTYACYGLRLYRLARPPPS